MGDDALNGRYKLESTEKFDDFLKELGVGFVMRNLAKVQNPTVEIQVNGNEITITTITTFKTSSMKFNVDEEFTETRLDGVEVKTKISREGNKLVQKQFGEKEAEIIREVNGDTLTTICKCGDVTSTRVYKRLPAA